MVNKRITKFIMQSRINYVCVNKLRTAQIRFLSTNLHFNGSSMSFNSPYFNGNYGANEIYRAENLPREEKNSNFLYSCQLLQKYIEGSGMKVYDVFLQKSTPIHTASNWSILSAVNSHLKQISLKEDDIQVKCFDGEHIANREFNKENFTIYSSIAPCHSESFNQDVPLNKNILKYNTTLNNNSQDNPVSSSQGQSPITNNDGPSESRLSELYQNLTENARRVFKKPIDLRIYTQDVILQNNITGTKKIGLVNYYWESAKLRIGGAYKYVHVEMDILKATIHPDESTIKIRWRVKGVTMFTTLVNFFKVREIFSQTKTSEKWIDGFSTFYVGRDGLIYKHVIDNMMSDEEKEEIKVTNKLQSLLGVQRVAPPQTNLSSVADSKEKKDSTHLGKQVS